MNIEKDSNFIPDTNILTTISTLEKSIVDILKDIEYLEELRENREQTDSDIQELYDARIFYDALKQTLKYYKNIL